MGVSFQGDYQERERRNKRGKKDRTGMRYELYAIDVDEAWNGAGTFLG